MTKRVAMRRIIIIITITTITMTTKMKIMVSNGSAVRIVGALSTLQV